MENEFNNFLMTDEEQQKYFPLDSSIRKKWQTWVPKGYEITNMQIYEAMSRGISVPTGDPLKDQEYIRFLKDFVLKPVEASKFNGPRKQRPIRWGDDLIEGEKGPIDIDPLEPPIGPPTPPVDPPIPPVDPPIPPVDPSLSPVDPPIPPVDPSLSPVDPPIPPVDPSLSPMDPTIPPIDPPTPPVDPPLEIEEFSEAIDNELEKDEETQLVRIVERKKAKLLPLILAAVMAFIMSGVRLMAKPSEKQVEQIVTDVLSYVIEQEGKTYDEVFLENAYNIKMGDLYYIENGYSFNTNSLMSGDSSIDGVTKQMGEEFSLEDKFAGKYPITGFAIIRNSDNKLLAYIEDFNSPQDNTKLSVFVEKTLKGTEINYEDIRVEFHFGRNDSITGEKSRLGWIDNGNIIFDEASFKEMIEESATYEGTIKNFTGDHVVISTKTGDVSIPVKDNQGNFYKPGDVVIGSDNKEYQISKMDLQEEINFVEREVENPGKQLSFDLKDCSLLVASPFLMMALAKYLEARKKNKKAEDNPYFEVVNDSQIEQYVAEFQQNTGTSGKTHIGSITPEKEFGKFILDGYYKATGILITNIEELSYGLDENNKFIVSSLTNPEIPAVDITEYMNEVTKNGESIGSGWSDDAASYFEEKGKGAR